MAVDFWSVIGSNTVMGRADFEAAVAQVETRLRALDPSDLVSFQDQLERNLDALDLSTLASIPLELAGGLVLRQTIDHFLYARCACLLAGRDEVRAVFEDSERFGDFVAPKPQSAEALLYLARTEHQRTVSQMG